MRPFSPRFNNTESYWRDMNLDSPQPHTWTQMKVRASVRWYCRSQVQRSRSVPPLLKDQDQSGLLTLEPFPDLNMKPSKTPTATQKKKLFIWS